MTNWIGFAPVHPHVTLSHSKSGYTALNEWTKRTRTKYECVLRLNVALLLAFCSGDYMIRHLCHICPSVLLIPRRCLTDGRRFVCQPKSAFACVRNQTPYNAHQQMWHMKCGGFGKWARNPCEWQRPYRQTTWLRWLRHKPRAKGKKKKGKKATKNGPSSRNRNFMAQLLFDSSENVLIPRP